MYAVSSSRTEQGIQFRAAMRRKQEQEHSLNEAAIARLAIVNERRRAAAAGFESALQMYREAMGTSVKGRPPVKQIIMNVARERGTTYEAIVGNDRPHWLIEVRFEAILRVKRAYPSISLPQIGRHFNKHHTTILNALRKMGYYDGRSARDRQEGAA